MRWAILGGSSLLFFLAAAKAHGRELRLERAAAGFDHVVFGGHNPAFVETLWRAERVRFWVVAPIAAAAILALLKSRGLDTGVATVSAISWGAVIAFAAGGAASLARAGGMREGIAGSLGWWAAVAAAGALAVVAARSATSS